MYLQTPANTEVKESALAPSDGTTTTEGLFGTEYIAQGCVVARMGNCTTGTQAQWEAHRSTHGLPEDAHVEVEGARGAAVFCWDADFTDVTKLCGWYKFNHSCEPNCKLQLDERKQPCWVAKSGVPLGEELNFKYSADHEEIDEAWCNCPNRQPVVLHT